MFLPFLDTGVSTVVYLSVRTGTDVVIIQYAEENSLNLTSFYL